MLFFIKMTPIDTCISMLSPQLTELFGKIRKYGLVGVIVSLGVGFKDSKANTIPGLALSLHLMLLIRCKRSATVRGWSWICLLILKQASN